MKIRIAVWPATLVILAIQLFTVNTSSLRAQCPGVSISAYAVSPMMFTTYDQLMAGGTASQYLSEQMNLSGNVYCPSWTLKVKAQGDFTNGQNSVGLSYTSIRFNTVVGGPSGSSIGISPNPFPLTTSETTIIQNSKEPLGPPYYTFDIKYDLIVQGGSHMLVPSNGEYQTTLTFYLYSQNGQLVASASTQVKFQIYYAPNDNSRLILQNGASNISLSFSTAADIANGVSDTKVDGLSVTTYSSHQVIVKASSSSMVAPGISYTIPVSAVNLTVTAPGSLSAITCYTIPLSTASQVVITNPMIDYTYQVVPYTLRYFISGGNTSISGGPPGVYTTSIVFAIVPL